MAEHIEKVQVNREGDREVRQRIVRDRGKEARLHAYQITQLIWVAFGFLISSIGLRVLLKLLGANPQNAFTNLVYQFTNLFLWPFNGMFASPSVNGMVLEVSSLIAMFVYAVIAWIIARLAWLLIYRSDTRSVTTYERR
jgi:YGGT family